MANEILKIEKGQCGIYQIRNIVDGKIYIGSSLDIKRRLRTHVGLLNSGKHYNPHMQRAWKKYGKDSFEFMIVELCPMEVLILREIAWVAYHNSMNQCFGYNLAMPDRSIQSKEVRMKISKAGIGRVASDETKRKMSESHRGLLTGKVLSDDHKLKLSLAHKGKTAPNKGKQHSEESIRKMSEVKKEWWKSRKEAV